MLLISCILVFFVLKVYWLAFYVSNKEQREKKSSHCCKLDGNIISGCHQMPILFALIQERQINLSFSRIERLGYFKSSRSLHSGRGLEVVQLIPTFYIFM